MPAVAWWILGGLVQIAGSLAGRVLLSLGFGFMTYTGVSVTLGWLKTQMLAGFAGLSPQILGLISMMKVGEAISILFSALLVRLTLNGLSTGGAISKLVKTG
jgi:hypothetical protein